MGTKGQTAEGGVWRCTKCSVTYQEGNALRPVAVGHRCTKAPAMRFTRFTLEAAK